MNKLYLVLIVVLAVSVSMAATFPVWGEPGTLEEDLVGNWAVSGNWAQYTDDPEWAPTGIYALPTATDVALIKTGKATVSSSVGAVKGIEVGEDTAELAITTGGSLEVQTEGTNGLSLGLVGMPDSYGILTMDGGYLSVGGDFRWDMGYSGNAYASITGGTVDITASFGLRMGDAGGYAELYIDNAEVNINTLALGNSGDGEAVVIQDGGDVTISSQFIIGDRYAAKKGTYVLNGGTLAMPSSGISMSFRGCESLLVVNGGTVTTASNRDISVGKKDRPTDFDSNTATLEINGGSVSSRSMYAGFDPNSPGVENGSSGVINMTGGVLNLTGELRLADKISTYGSLTISGGEIYTGGHLVLGGGDMRPEQAGDGGGIAELTVIGSDPNINIGSRLDAKLKNNASIRFVMDAGGVAPIKCGTLALIDSPTIYVDVLPEFDGQPGDTFDVIISNEPTHALPIQGMPSILVNQSPYYTFSQSKIDGNDDGRENVYRLTLDEVKIETCEDIIGAGKQMAGDINQDCSVDLLDFAIIAADWLKCNDPQGCY